MRIVDLLKHQGEVALRIAFDIAIPYIFLGYVSNSKATYEAIYNEICSLLKGIVANAITVDMSSSRPYFGVVSDSGIVRLKPAFGYYYVNKYDSFYVELKSTAGTFEISDRSLVELVPFLKYVYSQLEVNSFNNRYLGLACGAINDVIESENAENDIHETERGKLPSDLPKLRKKVKELTYEKEKWDASIEAAAKIGLLFYDNNLDKPISKDEFSREFSEQLGNGLPDSTIARIFRFLPSGYRHTGGRPKKDANLANIDIIIQAAAFAGTLYEVPERLTLNNLKDELKTTGIPLPDDSMLKKIISTVKGLDI